MTSSTLASTDAKTCRKCLVEKPLTSFHRSAKHIAGRQPYCSACNQVFQNAWRAGNRERIKGYKLKSRYGLTPAQFHVMREAQLDACAICLETFVEVPHVDHCHTGGQVRALLCENCNRALGMMRDKPERLEAAAAYLRLHASTLNRTTDDASQH